MKLRVGLIGFGGWAQQTYLPFLRSGAEIELSAASGTSKEQSVKEAGFKQFYQNWAEMIKQEKLDLVIITTPHAFHFDQIKLCLEHDCHVHVDKPPALKKSEVEELLALAKKKNLVVNVHSQRRFYPEYQDAQQAIQKGQLGKIEFVQGDFGQQLFDDFVGSWRSNPDLAGGGIVIDSGYHILDSILYILGTAVDHPHSVVMVSNNGAFKSDTFSTVSTLFNNNCVITINVIRGLPKNISTERIQIVGTKGWLLISRDKRMGKTHLHIEQYDHEGKQLLFSNEEAGSVNKAAPLEELLSLLRSKKSPNTHLESAITTVSILEGAYTSKISGQVVTLT